MREDARLPDGNILKMKTRKRGEQPGNDEMFFQTAERPGQDASLQVDQEV
jgi:hypothetical protein